jgi:hypothetical protein
MIEVDKIKKPQTLTGSDFSRKFEITTNQIRMANLHNSDQEIWVSLPGFNDSYIISNLGHIKKVKPPFNATTDNIFKGMVKNKTGYYRIRLTIGLKRKRYFLHRLIAKAFIPNPENKPYINHKNGIKTDNRIENLEWVTPRENNIHALEIGLYTMDKFWEGRTKFNNKGQYPYNKVVLQYKNGILIKEWACVKDAGTALGLKKFDAIRNCCRGQSKTSSGYEWAYKDDN